MDIDFFDEAIDLYITGFKEGVKSVIGCAQEQNTEINLEYLIQLEGQLLEEADKQITVMKEKHRKL